MRSACLECAVKKKSTPWRVEVEVRIGFEMIEIGRISEVRNGGLRQKDWLFRGCLYSGRWFGLGLSLKLFVKEFEKIGC
jgi:hypothetical protein